ncbi:hypothetical protein [Moorena sp. SIO3I6]|nr:hypothetical protein [Moorena sp. SIO3I6]
MGRWGDGEMGRWGDGEMGEIFIKRCSAVLGVSPMSDCIKTG